MKVWIVAAGVIAAIGGASQVSLHAGTPEQDFPAVREILTKYCYECHSSKKAEGGLNLERFDSFAAAQKEKPLWEGVQGRFFPREMPPEGAPQPNDRERDQLRNWLTAMVKHDGDCTEIANDRNTNFYRGHVMSRRLTRTEYANAIRDLTGVEINAVELLPSDGSGGEGFDAVGDSLFLSPIHLERYLETAQQVTAALWPEAPQENEPERLRQRRAEIGGDVLIEGVEGLELARKTLAPLARLAFRRPVPPEELDRYLKFYQLALERGESHRAGLRLALQGILLSPHFFFLAEPEPETPENSEAAKNDDGIHPLPDHALAARLAAFLWSSLPDEELLDAADAGILQQDDELRKQVRRMLKDPRARALGENFGMQWLGLMPLGGTVQPDPNQFPEFTPDVAQAMKSETALFIAGLFMEDRSLLELIDSDYTYLNESLARLYGIPDVQGPEMRKVSLPDRKRGGVLTQASVLTVSSYPLRTSPVLRGRWLLEELLGSRVPPPPPGVPPLPEADENGQILSLREQLEKHRSNPQCSSCHNRMDPLGFGLENFDPIGRWRDQVSGLPIDSTGTLPSGESFNGPAELKDVLLKRKNEVLRHLSRKLYGFAMGRQLNKFDDCVIQGAVTALEQNDYRAGVLVEHIALSYQFRHRFIKK